MGDGDGMQADHGHGGVGQYARMWNMQLRNTDVVGVSQTGSSISSSSSSPAPVSLL